MKLQNVRSLFDFSDEVSYAAARYGGRLGMARHPPGVGMTALPLGVVVGGVAVEAAVMVTKLSERSNEAGVEDGGRRLRLQSVVLPVSVMCIFVGAEHHLQWQAKGQASSTTHMRVDDMQFLRVVLGMDMRTRSRCAIHFLTHLLPLDVSGKERRYGYRL